MQATVCPVCKSEHVVAKYRLYDDRYGYQHDFEMMRCKECGHHFLLHDLAANDIEKLYTDYYPRAEITPETVKPLQQSTPVNAWLKGEQARACFWVPENVNVLDVGCGSGETLLYHRKRGCDVVGTETDANVTAIAEHHDLKISIGTFDRKNFVSNSFDYITLDQVVEHLSDPGMMMHDLCELMKPGASLIVSTPNASGIGARLFGRHWVNWHTPYHLHLFTEKSMRLLAKKAGLEVIECRKVTSSDWLFFQFMHLLALPQKGTASLYWLNKPLPDAHQVYLRKMINMIKKLRVTDLLTRLFDSAGIGDNLVFVLKKRSTSSP